MYSSDYNKIFVYIYIYTYMYIYIYMLKVSEVINLRVLWDMERKEKVI